MTYALLFLAFCLGAVAADFDARRRLGKELDKAEADALFWRLVADGTNHHPACERGFQGSTGWGLCMRCQLEDARA